VGEEGKCRTEKERASPIFCFILRSSSPSSCSLGRLVGPKMTPPSRLCSECATVPFDKLQRGEDVEHQPFMLGLLSRIRGSHCPFCILVHRAIVWANKATTPSPSLLCDREIILRWGRQPALGLRLAFDFDTSVVGDVWLAFGSQDDAGGRHETAYVVPKLPSEIDIVRVSSWIKVCTANHDCIKIPGESPSPATLPLGMLRLIDVDQVCLVETEEVVEYIVLSYMWGLAPNFRLTTANLSQLMEPGVLGGIRSVGLLPMTICDAITLAQRLKIRYLWIDSLCLIQNDPEDLERGIRIMDRIYEHASITIIAAHGHDANAGLPGVQANFRETRAVVSEIKPGICLGICMNPGWRLVRTVYETRAWTYASVFSRLESQRVC